MRTGAVDDMLMSITTPGLPPVYGEYGLWETALALPALASLRQGLLDRPLSAAAYLEADVFETNEVSVCLNAPDRWPTAMQFLNCRWLEHSEAELAESILKALVAHLPILRDRYDFLDADERERVLPLDATPKTLRRHTRLRGITTQAVHSATPYFGIALDCAWDEEHGLGLVLCGTEVIEIGGTDMVSSEGTAEAHYAGVLARLSAGPAAG
ncbi:DUF6985 domain-containing protein [Methylobacterium iners]|uniref:DUF6985 domain-containing protein n=1 Tax=Methylobacterium iners TaxID=418707 RepID=A0ABQ4RZB9_9HYPH|nr:hypothetical protein [Methylobacterium iners]GJD95512.1 hypothetical protein OCOJLMKI_2725 [Methylobacterium iners]